MSFNYNYFYSVRIGGYAGQGVKLSGLILAKVACRSGYNIFTHTEFPSLIKGGHNVIQINISEKEIGFPTKKIDLLISLNRETIDLYAHLLTEGNAIIYDSKENINTSKINKKLILLPVPIKSIATNLGGKELIANTVALGAAVAFLGGEKNIGIKVIEDQFSNKGENIVSANCSAFKAGYDYIKTHFGSFCKEILHKNKQNKDNLMIMNGNDAAALGAIASGLQFASIYPMSPISSVIDTLAAHQEKYGYIYIQPEDEISAINMALGASYAGVRSMVVTSGGGFCLMTEGLGLAGMTETPIVIVNGMRPGPATGLPTWSEQGDLRFVLHAHQGDFPRIVLSAGDAKEAFLLTVKSFNLAEKYQLPVILLLDKNICECEQSFPVIDTKNITIEKGKFTTQKIADFKRYDYSEDGISTRSFPGCGNFFIANSDEHNVYGFSTEDAFERKAQVEKRMKKLDTCLAFDTESPILFGPQEADITIVSWGSNKGSILEVINQIKNINFLYINWLNPFPYKEVKKILLKSKRVVDIECNYSAHLACLIAEKTGFEIKEKLLKYDGRPFYPEEIINSLKI